MILIFKISSSLHTFVFLCTILASAFLCTANQLLKNQSLNLHLKESSRVSASSLSKPPFLSASYSRSCSLTHGGSFGRSHKLSLVSLCLKSGSLGFFLHHRLLSHHSSGLAKNNCHNFSLSKSSFSGILPEEEEDNMSPDSGCVDVMR